MGLVGNQPHLLSHEVVPWLANATVSIPVIVGILRTYHTSTTDSDEPNFAPAADFEPILVKTADWRNENVTGLSSCVVYFVHSTSLTGAVDPVVPERTHAGLVIFGVNFVLLTGNVDA